MVPSIYGENMFDDFFDNSFFGGHSPLFGKHERNLMKTDIHETDDAKAYRFAVELPGFQKDEIHVDVKDGYLTVSAQKGLDKDEEDKKGRVLRQERYAGACSRSFYVGDVKAEDVKAKYESGVLTVLIPKKEPKKIVSGNRRQAVLSKIISWRTADERRPPPAGNLRDLDRPHKPDHPIPQGRWCTIVVEFYHDRSQSRRDSAKGGGNVI